MYEDCIWYLKHPGGKEKGIPGAMVSKVAGLYDMEETLGSGHFAVVKSARHVFTGLRVAIKVIDKAKLDEVSKAHLYQEVRCMKLVTHPSIIRLYEVIDTQTKLYLIQELGDGGDLYDFIMKHPTGIEENLARQIFRQTVSAIRYCHKLHVVHRDLKPENLVFCLGRDQESLRVKLTDFGLSRTFLPGELIESSCGSLEYSAPEILLGDSYDPPKVDVWSLGVILFMMITGRSPFASGGPSETLTHIMDGKYHLPSHVTANCRSLVSTMLVVDAQRRSSLEAVIGHPWLTEGQWEETVPLPSITSMEEIPPEDTDYIMRRMEVGGYGSQEDILKNIVEVPYGSTAATFFLLAEAERHRKLCRPPPSPSTPTHRRKVSLPVLYNTHTYPNGPFPFMKLTTPSPVKRGSAETGVLQRRNTPLATPSPRHRYYTDAPSGRANNDNTPTTSQPSTPVRTLYYQNYNSPHVGMAGEQVSQWQSPKPAFPLNVQQTAQEEPTPTLREHVDHFRPTRQLSVFEEESESESIPDTRPRSMSVSPHPLSPRSRRLANSRSSPNIFTSISKSDASEEEEEEDDDIVELITTSGRFPKTSTFPRLSPSNSPLLTSRRSPTHYWTGSSDEELSGVFEATRKHRNKRMPYRKRNVSRLARVDSVSSDDGGNRDKHRRLRNKDKLLRMRQYNSLPATTADTASDSLSELLENMRRQRSGSTRTDSSLSGGEKDMSELANSLVSRFELSDEDSTEKSLHESCMETEETQQRTGNTTLRSVFCCIL